MLRISPRTSNRIGREAPPGQVTGINRERGQLSFHCVTRNSPPSLRKTTLGGHLGPQSARPPTLRPRHPGALRPTLRLPASASTDESAKWLRATATAPGVDPNHAKLNLGSAVAGMEEQPALRFSAVAGAARTCEAGCRLCFRGRTQHILCVWSFVPHSHINSDRADRSPLAGPFGTEFMSHNMALCADPLPRCHADCFPPARRCGSHSRRHATARCVAVTAPACRHPSRQPPLPPFY